MRKLIFMPTIQATGTWFCARLIQKHSGIDYFSDIQFLDRERINEGTSLITVHYGLETFTDLICREKDYEKKFLSCQETLQWIQSSEKVVIPLRDPLLSLITAIRRPHVPSGILNGFKTLASWPKDNMFFVPVDLYASHSVEERYELLKGLFDYLGLGEEPFMKEWAESWPVENTMGSYMTKKIYIRGNFSRIERRIPQVKSLIKMKDILRPFLESVGYRDLLWWG